MRNILIVAQYDGTDFAGWQHQPEQRTVQTTLAQAIEHMVGHAAELFASSRTDAGVHARMMPVSFETERDHIPTTGFVKGLNTLLPADLSVTDARDMPLGWRPRDAAVAKTYTYRLQLGPRRALSQRFTWWRPKEELDLAAMRVGAAHFLGEHDFAAFRSVHCDAHTTRRRMYRVDVSQPDPDRVVSVVVTGNAFLRNMVRIIAGTLVEVGAGRRAPASVATALASGARTDAGPTAPACGLTLTEVHFEGYPRLGKRGAPTAPSAEPSLPES